MEVIMLTVRHAEERGSTSFGWLDSRHTFSFGHYYDPQFMGFGSLRVINEDRVKPNQGFDTHGHQDMEIISYVLEGALEHKDSMGTGSIIRPGDVQRMSAGTGVRHSEFNASASEPVHFLQIWVLPERQGLAPSYQQQAFSDETKRGQLKLVGSRDGRADSITIHQDINLYATVLGDGETVTHQLAVDRKGWLQVVRGSVKINGKQLTAGDGVAMDAGNAITLTGVSDTEVLLFDMG
jgi:redox-sensitive bicupin YhaK (pirin superfamily)